MIPESVWHDLECGSYRVDLVLWRELAEDAGPVLDVGCGTGRVALDLAARGYEVTALDSDPDLVDELARRAREAGIRVDAVAADARSFALGRKFGLAIAPMQVVQLLGGPAGRRRVLERVRSHLEDGGVFAVAIADPFEGLEAEPALPPLPDVREQRGWVFSSMPVTVRSEPDTVAIDLLRQAVSPEGDLSEAMATVTLDVVEPETFEREGRACGFRPLAPRRVDETRHHVGSTVVLLEAA